jgi:2-oxoglutarate ferredoxin oxidoreductase subunit gamma
MVERLISSGFGGQGVLSAGLILVKTAVRQGLQATFFPAYGAEMRGGTAYCQVIISDDKIGSPVVTEADTLFAFNDPSVTRFAPAVNDKGLIMVNSSIVKQQLKSSSKEIRLVPVTQLAIEKIGNQKTANIILIGAYLKIRDLLKLDDVMKTVEELFKDKGPKIVDMNHRALELGFSGVY